MMQERPLMLAVPHKHQASTFEVLYHLENTTKASVLVLSEA